MNFIKKRPLLLISAALFGLSILVRFQIYTLTNEDVVILQGWYREFFKHGMSAFANENFSNYTPAYLYLLYITRLFSDWFGDIIAIKLIPSLFDFVSAFAVFLLARIRYADDRPFVFSAIFFALPTVIFNSTGWGQIESMYTSFLLLCAYFISKEKPVYAMLMYGIAFSFKSQSIFFLPFLGILFLKGRVRWHHFLLVPAVYIVLAIPAALLGRSWESILSIYINQVGQFRSLSMSAPNLYAFVPDVYYEPGVWVGMIIFFCVMAVWGWVNWRAIIKYEPRNLMIMALASLVLATFFLPKMHERYFYPVDVFSFAAALFIPEMWFAPILYQIVSGLSYSVFILSASPVLVQIAAVISTVLTIFILRKQLRSLKGHD